ncbi:tetratricopeptide repeat protein [Paenibacillus chitinolyticus]|uniref:tetratricopeptide repeat protein n=1 Tax=Paenibacillus chitinolyticus TaxID=79263 RepID=UPI0036270E68
MKLFNGYYIKKGRQYIKEGNFAKALQYYEKVDYGKLDTAEKIRVAEVYHECGRTENALSLLGDIIGRVSSDQAHERRAYILQEIGREEEAMRDLDEAIRLNPEPYMYWYTRGIWRKDFQDYEAAAADLEECVKREPEDSVVSSYYELGMCYWRMEDYGRAEQTFRKVLSYPDRDIPIFHYRLGKTLENLGRLEEAAASMRKAVDQVIEWEYISDKGQRLVLTRTGYGAGAFRIFMEEAERTCGFRKDLAGLYAGLKRYGEALEEINRALETYPDNDDLYLQRVAVYRSSGRWEDAERELDVLEKERDVEERVLWMERVLLYRAQNRDSEAVPLLHKLYEQDSGNPIVCYWLADAYLDLGQTEKALEFNKRLLELEDDDPLNEQQRGLILEETGAYGQAASAYGRAIAMQDRADFRMKRSYAYFMDSRFDEALMDLHHAAELEPGISEGAGYHHAMGRVLEEMGHLDMAIASFTKAIDIQPEHAAYYESRAKCYLTLRELEKAELDCIVGYDKDASYTDLISLRGNVLYLKKEYAESRNLASQFSRLHPDSPSAFFNLGLVCFKLEGEEDAARNAFDQALALAPSYGACYIYKAYLDYGRLDFREAIENLANWSLFTFPELSLEERLEHLEELDGLNETVLEGAARRITELYQGHVYLS